MAFLSQASHLGSLLLPHDAFQEHAAHRAEWSAQLSSKGSERTCIRSGLATFLSCTFTAHSDFVVKPHTLHDPLEIVKVFPHVGSSAIPTIYLEGDPCATLPVRPAKIGPSPSIFSMKRRTFSCLTMARRFSSSCSPS